MRSNHSSKDKMKTTGPLSCEWPSSLLAMADLRGWERHGGHLMHCVVATPLHDAPNATTRPPRLLHQKLQVTRLSFFLSCIIDPPVYQGKKTRCGRDQGPRRTACPGELLTPTRQPCVKTRGVGMLTNREAGNDENHVISISAVLRSHHLSASKKQKGPPPALLYGSHPGAGRV